MKISTIHHENLDRSSWKSPQFLIKISIFHNKVSTVYHKNKSQLLAELAFHILDFMSHSMSLSVFSHKHIKTAVKNMLLGKGVLKIWSKFTGEHLCWSVISIKLLCIFFFVISIKLLCKKVLWKCAAKYNCCVWTICRISTICLWCNDKHNWWQADFYLYT